MKSTCIQILLDIAGSSAENIVLTLKNPRLLMIHLAVISKKAYGVVLGRET